MPTSITTSCIVMHLTIFLWAYLQSIKIGTDIGKAWVSLGWFNQSHLCLATRKPAIAGTDIIGSRGRRAAEASHPSVTGRSWPVSAQSPWQQRTIWNEKMWHVSHPPCTLVLNTILFDKSCWLNCVASKIEHWNSNPCTSEGYCVWRWGL